MKKITKEFEIYSFDELPQEVQDEVITKYYEINLYPDWYELEFNEFKKNMLKQGVEVKDIFFTGFDSQGDGASFNGVVKIGEYISYFNLDEKYPLTAELIKKYGEHWYTIIQAGYYSHSGTMYLEVYDYIADSNFNVMSEIKTLEKEVIQFLRDKADELYDTLEASYDYLTSKEQIIATLKANDYEFLRDGSIFN